MSEAKKPDLKVVGGTGEPNRAQRRGKQAIPPGMVMVPRDAIFFPSPGDPEGKYDVLQKWSEAKAMCDLMVTAIARSGVSIELLDFPGARALLEAHAIANDLTAFPGESIIHMAVGGIRATREAFQEPKPDLSKVKVDAPQAPASLSVVE